MLVDKLPMIESRTNDMTNLDDMDWAEVFERLTEVSDRFRYGSDGAPEIYDPESDRTVSFLGFDSHEISVIQAALREAIHEEGWDVCEWSNKWNITDPDQGGLKMGSAPKESVTDYINFASAYLKAKESQETELKACPFCGAYGDWLRVVYMCENIPSQMHGHVVLCDNCGTRIGPQDSEQEANRAWNQRYE